MRYFFLIMGCLCILYYMVLAFYSRRMRSTFAVFWLFSGGVHLLFGCAPFPVYVYKVLVWMYLVCWIIFFIVEFRILRAMYSRCDEALDWIIVPGAQVRGRYITNSLKRRLDTALEYIQCFPQVKVVVSGGQGPGEDVSEAEAMAEYLQEKGIPPAQIFKEDKSVSTRENLRFSRKYIEGEYEKVGIVTNDFHIYRSSLIAGQEGYKCIYLIPADSNPVFQLNYLVREFFGVIHAFLFK